MKNRLIIFIFALISIVIYAYFTYYYVYNTKYKNIKININKMIADNKKYHVIDSDFQINDEYNLSQLEALNKEITERTFKKLNDDFKVNKDLFDLLKMENTNSYNEKSLDDYNELILLGSSKINKYSTKLDYRQIIDLLDGLRDVNKKLINLCNEEQKVKAKIGAAVYDAEEEIDTANEVMDDCFYQQENKIWQYNAELSSKYCNYLNLNTCNKNFNGFTMNNPKAVNSNLTSYTYVTLGNDVFKQNKLVYTDLKSDNNIYAEVYTRKIEGYTINKFNIIVIPKTYTLSCKFPS